MIQQEILLLLDKLIGKKILIKQWTEEQDGVEKYVKGIHIYPLSVTVEASERPNEPGKAWEYKLEDVLFEEEEIALWKKDRLKKRIDLCNVEITNIVSKLTKAENQRDKYEEDLEVLEGKIFVDF